MTLTETETEELLTIFNDLIDRVGEQVEKRKEMPEPDPSFIMKWMLKLNNKMDKANRCFPDSPVSPEALYCLCDRVWYGMISDGAGKEKLFGYFVGKVMQASKGKANPTKVNDILKLKLKGTDK